jgi:hypothetical protein
MKLVRAVSVSLSTLVLAGLLVALAVAPAGARLKPEFKPATGTYIGTMTSSVGTGQITGQVGKEGKKYIVQVLLSTTETCDDGARYPAGVEIPAPVQGKSFSAEETGTDAYSGGKATYKFNGHFTSEKEFTGTAGKSSEGSTKDPTIHSCTTGTIKFTLKFKTSKAPV